jgi:hypothetical protein
MVKNGHAINLRPSAQFHRRRDDVSNVLRPHTASHQPAELTISFTQIVRQISGQAEEPQQYEEGQEPLSRRESILAAEFEDKLESLRKCDGAVGRRLQGHVEIESQRPQKSTHPFSSSLFSTLERKRKEERRREEEQRTELDMAKRIRR